MRRRQPLAVADSSVLKASVATDKSSALSLTPSRSAGYASLREFAIPKRLADETGQLGLDLATRGATRC